MWCDNSRDACVQVAFRFIKSFTDFLCIKLLLCSSHHNIVVLPLIPLGKYFFYPPSLHDSVVVEKSKKTEPPHTSSDYIRVVCDNINFHGKIQSRSRIYSQFDCNYNNIMCARKSVCK